MLDCLLGPTRSNILYKKDTGGDREEEDAVTAAAVGGISFEDGGGGQTKEAEKGKERDPFRASEGLEGPSPADTWTYLSEADFLILAHL